ncbi:MAG: hypothetical protein LBQ63_01385 [Deltaproteobacteria bacterium]|jgi:hypothetical protein|nr:hypothetical protein [Deltaproteobacteria bacterium]
MRQTTHAEIPLKILIVHITLIFTEWKKNPHPPRIFRFRAAGAGEVYSI